jgi:hypothetical protein
MSPADRAAPDLKLAVALLDDLARATRAGAGIVRDSCGPGEQLIVGSHPDSVPQGGNFGGAAGAVAGLVVLAGFRRAGIVPACDIAVMAIRAEESAWFDVPHTGSAGAFGLDLGATGDSPADQMDVRLRAALRDRLGAFQMASGAGHDAAVFAAQGVPCAMIFVRNANGSHNPDEAMALEDFAIGAAALSSPLLTECA